MDFILDHIAQMGIDAGKDRIKDSIMETEAKERLTEFLKRQKKLCFNCTIVGIWALPSFLKEFES